MHSAGCEQARHGCHGLVRAAVAQDHQTVAVEHGERSLTTELVDRRFQPFAAFLDGVEHGDGRRLTDLLQVRFTQLGQIRIGQDRMRQFQHLRLIGQFEQEIAFAADVRLQAHHQLLTDRVDRGVGDLGEVLA